MGPSETVGRKRPIMCTFEKCERAKMPPSAINQHMKSTFSTDESLTLTRLLFHSSSGQRLPNICCFFFPLLYSFHCPFLAFVFVLYLYCTESAYKLLK